MKTFLEGGTFQTRSEEKNKHPIFSNSRFFENPAVYEITVEPDSPQMAV
jgi:hypothetical protein